MAISDFPSQLHRHLHPRTRNISVRVTCTDADSDGHLFLAEDFLLRGLHAIIGWSELNTDLVITRREYSGGRIYKHSHSWTSWECGFA